MNEKTPLLQLVDIDYHYRDSQNRLVILDRANFTLNAGEMVALVAPSGAGKSTLLHLAGLLERPKGGEVFLCGRASSRLNDATRTALRRADIGFVYQFHHLLPEFSALENVMLPQMIAGLAKNQARERAQRLLEYLRIGERAQHRPNALSGGEQQRVALARALASAPKIIIADEPTGNLDSETGLKIADLIFEKARELGTTMVIVTHDNGLAARCDRQIHLRNGVIEKIA